jgi:DNA-binding LacI/PurR family transcriptional regulator
MVKSEDVARKAGVSRATVSLVLNGRTDIQIPEATRQRVRDAARALGYRPHRSGRAVRSGKTGSVAFVLSSVSVRSLFTPLLLDGLIEGAARHDQHLLVARLGDESFDPKILREFAADGLILNYNSEAPPALAERIAQAKIPAIWINDRRAFDSVYPDDFEGARAATHARIAEGHARIGYAGWSPGPHYSMADRLDGYRAALEESGLEEHVALLERESPVVLAGCTAVLCYSPDVLKIAWQAGLRTKFSVIHASPFSTLEQDFTTYLLPDHALGRAAIELLMQKINSPDTPIPSHALPLTPSPPKE